jgi:hypothetical protein
VSLLIDAAGAVYAVSCCSLFCHCYCIASALVALCTVPAGVAAAILGKLLIPVEKVAGSAIVWQLQSQGMCSSVVVDVLATAWQDDS